jgi:short subunit dehydrogenase-like uncharacterized protein
VPGRIVVFGATGYTGRLTAEALVERGSTPLLAGRSADRLTSLADELGGLETAVADVESPASVRAIVGQGDVLVSTVGPFVRFGAPAVEAAIANRATYLDSTGEPAFIRRVFEDFGPRAASAGVGLVTAFGFDWVPGNLAGALALREAGEAAVRVDLGYYSTGGGGMSGGTRATTALGALEPAFVWRRGIRTERTAARVRSFEVKGRERPAVSVGTSEHFTLPRLHPQLAEVNAYLGWFGGASRALQAFSLVSSGLARVPGARTGMQAIAARFVKGSTGGPDAEARSRSGSYVVAEAYGAGGDLLSEVRLAGVNGYDFTARLLAWGADRALASGLTGQGALGPVEAFGLDELEAGCAEAGLEPEGAPRERTPAGP